MRHLATDTLGVCILAIFIAAVVGCVEREVTENLQPLIAVTGNYGVWDAAVGPTPAPKPSNVCSSCGGRGKVGDGRVSVPCAACDGTGVIGENPICKSGTCTTRSIVR